VVANPGMGGWGYPRAVSVVIAAVIVGWGLVLFVRCGVDTDLGDARGDAAEGRGDKDRAGGRG